MLRSSRKLKRSVGAVLGCAGVTKNRYYNGELREQRFALQPEDYSHEGGQLCRAFVETSVASIHAEEKLRQHFEEYANEARRWEV